MKRSVVCVGILLCFVSGVLLYDVVIHVCVV